MASAALAQAPAPVWPAPDWQASTPEEQGMDSRSLAALVEHGAKNRMDSLVVVRNGRIVTEAYYAPFKAGMKHRVNSATKGVVGVLAGIASGQGLLGPVDAPLLTLFPDRTVANADERKRAVTLQHLLDMTSGLDWTEPLDGVPETSLQMERSRDWPQFVLDRPMARQPGSAFNYNSGSSHLVSAIVARKTGMNTQDYADRELFKPLGITDWHWWQDPQKLSVGGYGLYLRTPDMAKIGWLYLNNGAWQGRQIVPAEWVRKVYRASVPMFGPDEPWRYADFWWTLPARKAYMAVGHLGQVILVMPESGIVAAMTGSAYNPNLPAIVDQLQAAARSPQALPPDAQGVALLRQRVREAASEKAVTVPAAPALAQEVSGRTWRFAANALGVREVSVNLGDAATLRVVSAARPGGPVRTVVSPLGLQGVSAIGDAGSDGIVASRAHWVDERTLRVLQHWPQEARTFTYELRFDGRRLEVAYTVQFLPPGTLHGEAAD